MKRISAFLQKQEFYLLALVALVFSLRFFSNAYFITLDGAAHLYNSNLIWGKLSGSFPLADQFYQWNPEPVPNWTGHFVLTLLNAFLRAADAEKLMLALYFFGMLFSLRYLIRAVRPENAYLSLLVVPIAFNTFLYFGFYNFCISLIFIFWLSGFVLRHKNNWNIKSYLTFGGLLLLSYFSHLSAFLMIGIFLLVVAVVDLIGVYGKGKNAFRMVFKKYVILFLFCLPALLLAFFYFLHRSGGGELIYLSLEETYKVFRYMRSLIVYADAESYWTSKLLYVLVFSVLLILADRLIKRKYFSNSDVLLLAAVVTGLSAFVLPDSDTRGGYMILRVVLIAYLFLIAWIAVQPMKWFVQIPLLLLVLALNNDHTRKLDETQKYFNKEVKEIVQAGQLIPENEVVLPVYKNAEWDWVSLHHANYIGADRNIILLENYEAAQDYFPLMYNDHTAAPIVFSVDRNFYCDHILKAELFSAASFDYVLEYSTDLNRDFPCESKLDTLLQTGFSEIYRGEFVRLHQRK